MDAHRGYDTATEGRGEPSRRAIIRGIGGAGLAALFAARWAPAAAQDTTPAPTGAIGVTAQLLGAGQPTPTPGLELTLRRLTIAPGGRLPAHSHPGSLVIYVEAGNSGYTVLGGTAHLTRAASDGTPVPAEEVPVGAEVILNPGDVLFAEDPSDDARNAGSDDLVLLIAGLTRVGEPFTMFMADMDMGGTPTS